MASVAVPAVLGAVGLMQQADANSSARKAASKAQSSQDALISRQTGLFDQIKQIVDLADKMGAFDPTQKLAQLSTDVSTQSKKDLGNQAGAFAALGYKPGDTPPIDALSATAAKYQKMYGEQAQAIRDNALWSKINAYRAINPSDLNTGISVEGQRAATAQGQVKSLSPIISSLSPYLTDVFKKKSTGFNTAPVTYPVSYQPYEGIDPTLYL